LILEIEDDKEEFFGEEEEIEEHYLKNIIFNYLPKVKISLFVITILLTIALYLFQNVSEQRPVIKIYSSRIQIFLILMAGTIVFVHYYPKYYTFIVPVYIGYLMECMTMFAVTNEEYPASEGLIPGTSLMCMLIIIVPSQVKSNCIVY
jgi:hypothetical protein